MKKTQVLGVGIICFTLLLSVVCRAGVLDDVFKSVKIQPSGSGPDEQTTISGLKEALSVGTGNAVTSTSKLDGYFANQAIKILLPDNIQKAADVLRKVGYQRQVDDFILSMNRAAENAAPKARQFFVDAIKQMSIQDAMKILRGGDTAATDYFKSKTFDSLYTAFKPSVATSMDKVGVTKSYKDMMGGYTKAVPFARTESVDLDHYVTNKALDGLFYMIGQEEKNIRTNPAARVTDLLKTVFGK